MRKLYVVKDRGCRAVVLRILLASQNIKEQTTRVTS